MWDGEHCWAACTISLKNRTGALVIGLLVVSHWLLDLLVHRPDLPLFPGYSPVLGFGLWNSLAVTILLEGLVFFGGLYFYLRSTYVKDKMGMHGFWGLIVFLLLIYAGNLFGSPPAIHRLGGARPMAALLPGTTGWIRIVL